MNRHENAAVSHRQQFERRAQKMPMARSTNPGWRKRDIAGGFATILMFVGGLAVILTIMVVMVGLLVIGGI